MDICPICNNTTESIKSESHGLHVACDTCGDFLITGECLDYLEHAVSGTIFAKTQRWLRETKSLGLRMISSAPTRVEYSFIRKYVTVAQLKSMYLRTGTDEEYNTVLRKCLALQKKLGRECVTFEEARDIFPTVDEKESRIMARKMAVAGDLGIREEDGIECIFVTPAGLERLSH
jgi:hypothetical protein